ncbi:TetR/AcrR family transcriptional regulator [Streptomyces sp. NPDC002867]
MAEPDSFARPSRPVIRERLVEAAVQEFGEQGYDRTRVQDIARRAGLSTGAIYGNFRNKAELLAEAVDYGLAAASHKLAQAMSSGAGPADVLALIVTDLSDPRQKTWAPLVSEALTAARRDAEVARRVYAALSRVESELRDLVELAQRNGTFGPMIDAAACARLVLCVSLGVDVLAAVKTESPDHGAWSSLMRVLFAGLGAAE